MREEHNPPIPYPRGLLKWLMKTPTLVYRLGLGSLIGDYILVSRAHLFSVLPEDHGESVMHAF